MAVKHDWVTRNHQNLCNQTKQTTLYIDNVENKIRMGLDGSIGKWITDEFDPKYIVYTEAFNAWKDPATRTQLNIVALFAAEKAFVPLYRKLYTGMLKNNPLVTDSDLVAMGMPKRPDKHREAVPEPTGVLEVAVKTPSPGVVVFHFRVAGETGHAKGYGIQGYELCGSIMDKEPEDWSELKQNYFTTTAALHIAFNGGLCGKRFYYAARQENNRGVKGDWNKIQFVVIP